MSSETTAETRRMNPRRASAQRTVEILLLLMQQRQSRQELCARFGISGHTLTHDLNAIERAGVTLYRGRPWLSIDAGSAVRLHAELGASLPASARGLPDHR